MRLQPSDFAGQVAAPGWMLLLLLAGLLILVGTAITAMITEGSWPPWYSKRERQKRKLRVVKSPERGPVAE